MAPSYRETNFSRKSQTARWGCARSMWQRQTQWFEPGLRASIRAAGWGVVTDHEFGNREEEVVRLRSVVREENLEIPRTCVIGRAVQGVVERFRDVKEILASGHHVPFEMEIQLFRKRHQAIQDFRYAATNGGGIDHLDAAAPRNGFASARSSSISPALRSPA